MENTFGLSRFPLDDIITHLYKYKYSTNICKTEPSPEMVFGYGVFPGCMFKFKFWSDILVTIYQMQPL